jgi:hypothetical protein
MRRRSWLRCFPVATSLLLWTGGQPAAAGAQPAPGNPFAGEWFLPGHDGGFLTVRDCQPGQNLCLLLFEAYGRGAATPGDDSRCSYGNPKVALHDQGLRVLRTDGKKATARLATSWGTVKACTVELELDDSKQPPSLKASFSGGECGYYCHGRTPFSATFQLRSRQTYLHFGTWSKNYVCFQDDSAVIRQWCTDEQLFALDQTCQLRRQQLFANTGDETSEAYGRLQMDMLEQCKAHAAPGDCLASRYREQLRELDAQVYGRFLDQKLSAEQVLAAVYPKFDPRTAKTGGKTDVNTKYASGEKQGRLMDELVVFFKIAAPAFLPGHVLLLDAVSDDFEGYQAKGFFTLLKVEGGRLKIVAREPVLMGDVATDPASLTWHGERTGASLKFDLANYKINDRERAFGFRLSVWDGGTGADYGSETLLLYRLVPEGMKRVLRVTMGSRDAEWDNFERKVYKDKQEHFILVVSPDQHEGNYDWIIKGRIVNKRIKRSRAAKPQTYIWKNGEYVLAPEAAAAE